MTLPERQEWLFHETQRFRWTIAWWVLAVLLAIFAIQTALGWLAWLGARGSWPLPESPPLGACITATFVTTILGAAFAFIHLSELTTVVTPEGLLYRFFPFHLRFRRRAFHDIEQFEAVTYRPILGYGGWGLRWGWKGKALSVSGNRGVRITFRNGKRLMIGSRRAEELVTNLRFAHARADLGPSGTEPKGTFVA